MKILTIVAGDMKTYSRGRIIYQGLKENGFKIKAFSVKNKLGYFRLMKRLLKRDYDLLLINGIIPLVIAKLLSRKPIILDAFISHYDNLVNDRKKIPPNTLESGILWWADKLSCKFAHKVILDTQSHIDYFVKEFNLNENKFWSIPVGADNNVFVPKKKKSKIFKVVFIGTYIPLQGIEYIVKAIKILEKENIVFDIVGEGQTKKEIMKLAKKLKIKNTNFYGNQSLENLTNFMKEADICLGIFGKSDKTKKVVPNKVYEGIAMNKAVITSHTRAICEDFSHKKNIYLCAQANEISLAKSILCLKNNTKLRKKIANNGYKLFKKKFSCKKIGKQMKEVINGNK